MDREVTAEDFVCEELKDETDEEMLKNTHYRQKLIKVVKANTERKGTQESRPPPFSEEEVIDGETAEVWMSSTGTWQQNIRK